MMNDFRKKLYTLLFEGETNKKARKIEFLIMGLVGLNISTIIAQSFMLPASVQGIMITFEIISGIIFLIEYILRLLVADIMYKELKIKRSRARLKYAKSPLAIIDLISLLPYFIWLVLPVDITAMRTLRALRLFKIFKFGRYSKAMGTIKDVFKKCATQLQSSIFIICLLVLISSILMYGAEHGAQPKVFVNAFSGMWWAIVTITTIGYGDMYPVTVLGKILASFIALLGIGLIAIPTGLITAGFMSEMNKNKEDKNREEILEIEEEIHSMEKKVGKYCPHCGEKIN